MEKYNGFSNWATWNVFNSFEFETKQDLEYIENNILEKYENIEDDFIRSFIDIYLINWKELLKGCES